MKLSFRLFVFKKTLFAIAVLLGTAELSAGRSLLQQERGDVDFVREELFGANDSISGALTLENLYNFDYANAGLGTVIFRTNSKRFLPAIFDQDAPRVVADWSAPAQFNSFINPNFAVMSPSFVGAGSVSPFDDSNDPTSPGILAPVPEPSTWIGALLALMAIAFTQRQRLRGFVARCA
jgi:hypothetical protein